jgi:hypothetical protein
MRREIRRVKNRITIKAKITTEARAREKKEGKREKFKVRVWVRV